MPFIESAPYGSLCPYVFRPVYELAGGRASYWRGDGEMNLKFEGNPLHLTLDPAGSQVVVFHMQNHVGRSKEVKITRGPSLVPRPLSETKSEIEILVS